MFDWFSLSFFPFCFLLFYFSLFLPFILFFFFFLPFHNSFSLFLIIFFPCLFPLSLLFPSSSFPSVSCFSLSSLFSSHPILYLSFHSSFHFPFPFLLPVILLFYPSLFSFYLRFLYLSPCPSLHIPLPSFFPSHALLRLLPN